MGDVLVISDLHLGHKKILQFAKNAPGAYRGGTNIDEHDEWVVQQMLSAGPTKRTLWWILGDICMARDPAHLRLLDRVPGKKRLILGNHDLFDTEDYLKHFEWIGGTLKKYGVWFSHVPMHPDELRQMPGNVHGHCHHGPVMSSPHHPDVRYLNLAIDFAPKNAPVSLEYIRHHFDIKE